MRINRSFSRKSNRQRRTIILSILGLFFVFSVGYAAFQTAITIIVKGNIKIRTDFYVSSNGSDVSGKGTLNSPYASIQKAYDSITKSPSIIHIMNDITQVETLTMSENKDVTLISYGNNVNSIVRDNNLTGDLISVSNGKLILQNIILNGNNIQVTNSMLLRLRNSSETTIESGTEIKNAKNTGSGSAILLNDSSSLTMNSGEISNNNSSLGGAGIFMNTDETFFTMNGGSIINNSGKDSVGIWSRGSIVLNNGAILNNTATNQAGAIQCYKSLVMNGGTISNNVAGTSAGAINLINTCQFTMFGGTISHNTSKTGSFIGGSGTFTYNSGVICENNPTSNYETHETCPN